VSVRWPITITLLNPIFWVTGPPVALYAYLFQRLLGPNKASLSYL